MRTVFDCMYFECDRDATDILFTSVEREDIIDDQDRPYCADHIGPASLALLNTEGLRALQVFPI